MRQSTARSKQPHSKRKKWLTILAICVFVLVLLPTTALAYVGFVPGVTELMHTNRPVDLGVRYSLADYDQLAASSSFPVEVSNYDTTHGYPQEITKVKPGSNLLVFGTDTASTTLTQGELTAFVNLLPWTNSPISNAQVRLSPGTLEFSGNVQAWYVSNLIKDLYPTQNYGQLSPFVKLAGHLVDPAIYIKIAISVDNVAQQGAYGLLHLQVQALKVNRMDLTGDVSKMSPINTRVGKSSWSQSLNLSLGSLTISNGQLAIYGNIPSHFSVGDGDPTQVCQNDHGGIVTSLTPVNGHIGSVVASCPV